MTLFPDKMERMWEGQGSPGGILLLLHDEKEMGYLIGDSGTELAKCFLMVPE
jgi:hypothetical protein